mgnify:CR=1 FL=1
MDLPENHAGEQREAPTPYGAGPLAGLGGAVPESRHPRTHRQSSGSLIPSCRGRSNEHHHTGPRALKSPQKPFSGLKMVTDRLRDDHGPAPEKSQSSS